MKSMILLLPLCWTIQASVGEFTTTDATKIHNDVFGTTYNNYVRPSATTYIGIEFFLLSINEMDVKKQIMSSSGWLTVTWEDPRLTWDSSSYGGIEYIYTKQDKIWRPELIVDNSVEGMSPIGHDEIFFKVKHTGEVRWDPPGRYVTHCDSDVTYYPFDYQKCSVEVTSFAFNTSFLTLNSTIDKVNTEDYNENGEWILHSSRVEEQFLTEHNEKFSQLEFEMIFKRRASYYVTNIVYPLVLISLLTNLVFLIPADSGEKISFILTVLLAQAVLLAFIGGSMPTASIHLPIMEETSNDVGIALAYSFPSINFRTPKRSTRRQRVPFFYCIWTVEDPCLTQNPSSYDSIEYINTKQDKKGIKGVFISFVLLICLYQDGSRHSLSLCLSESSVVAQWSKKMTTIMWFPEKTKATRKVAMEEAEP